MPVSDGRVLLLGDFPVGYANGIGETLANLFADYNDADLFQLHPSHLQAVPGQQRGRVATFETPRLPHAWPAFAAVAYQPILKLRQRAAQQWLFEQAARLVRDNQIDAVLTYPVTPWVLFAVVRLRRAFPRVRFAFYVMDDWEGLHTCYRLPFTARRRAALAEIVATSDARFACSHKMQADYERRFGAPWQVLHKGVDPAASGNVPARRRDGVIHILYTGGMNLFRFDAVVAFAEGIELYRRASGREVVLTLLGPTPDPEYREGLDRFAFIRTEAWVDNATAQRRLADADYLYLPLSFARQLDRIANLAMPAKFSEYLASGRPLICHVPEASEVYDLVAGAGLPLTLTTTRPAEIRDFFAAQIEPGIDGVAYRAAAQTLIEAEFDQSVLRARLRDALFPRSGLRAG